MFAKKSNGFTLTEVLVVVLIIAVLTVIAYPLYTRSINKSRAMEAVNLLEIVRAKQIERYARTRTYYNNFTDMGQLTGNLSAETKNGAIAKVKNYTLALKEGQKCLTATYTKKGKNIFSFSSGYEQSGLGCTDETGGNFCTSFGDVVGTAESVCNCNGVTCGSGYSVNPSTCQCECLLGCSQGGNCYAPYGGGQTRSCSSMGGSATCGTQTSIDSCNGPVWTGTCSAPRQTQSTSQSCGGGNGIQTRTCSANCTGGSCGSWGGCVCNSGYVWNGSTCVSATCNAGTKPAETETCGKCGSRSRSVTCSSGSWVTGAWGSCQNEGVCTVGSTNCNAYCECNAGYVWSGSACVSSTCDAGTKPAETEDCGTKCGKKTRTVTCTSGAWVEGAWSACKNEGECAKGSANCNASCQCNSGYTWNGASCASASCPADSKPVESKKCGNCQKGTESRTVTCLNGVWVEGSWSACVEPDGTCVPGAQKTGDCVISSLGGKQLMGESTYTCTTSCQWDAGSLCKPALLEDPNPGHVSAVKSRYCCPEQSICRASGWDGNYMDCNGKRDYTATFHFDFNAQYCVDNKTWQYHSLFSCSNLFECGPIPSDPGHATYCGRLQLYECPSGYSFDSGGVCREGTSGKKLKSGALGPIPIDEDPLSPW